MIRDFPACDHTFPLLHFAGGFVSREVRGFTFVDLFLKLSLCSLLRKVSLLVYVDVANGRIVVLKIASIVYTSHLGMCMLFSQVALLPVYDINSLQDSYFGIWSLCSFDLFPNNITLFGLHGLGTCFADSIKVDLQYGVQNPTKIDTMRLQGLNLNPGISEKGT